MSSPFQFGSTAHLPPRTKGKSNFILIDIGQHPVIYSRAVGTLQPEEKLDENEDYLLECRRVCEATCPIREPEDLNVTCKRLSLISAMAKTTDYSELDIQSWSKILCRGLCKPALY
jgi:hypothetical protein